MNIILIGPPGSGKGTQSKFIENKFGVAQLSTGDMLRSNIALETEIGIKAQSIIDSGELVSDEIILDIIAERIKEQDCMKGFILDGFPRNINQAIGLDKMLEKSNKNIDIVVELTVVKNDLFNRIRARSKETEFARADDTEDVLKKRLEIYDMQTKPIIPYYENKKLLHKVNGMEKIETVANNINEILIKILN